MAVNILVASMTLIRSSPSFLTTLGALIFIGLHHTQRRSLRHVLIINLMVAGKVKSRTRPITLSRRLSTSGTKDYNARVLDGVVGQRSVQASDFSILAIAIATLLVIRREANMADGSSLEKLSICCCVWVVPITNSALAAGMGVMEPVSGNWCWITRDRPDLRFALAHVWRLWIMFTTVCVYAFVWRYLSQHLRATASTSWLSCDAESSTVRMTTALTHQSSNKPSHHFSKMRLTGVLAFCATVYGMAISNVPNGTENEISIPQDDSTAATHEDHFSASGIFSRDQSKAWREPEKVVGRPLETTSITTLCLINRPIAIIATHGSLTRSMWWTGPTVSMSA
ncbi:hypothetical protein CGCS363_v015156 [Colletotrichum siamense]|uniref:uncharacterized protein n=1 Tax=Colletotrichum siamense TaxID=690259 RepID=UPI0018731069|nr:uncharacterized protein CGCS363_v015156 [Colletotrichum siamense]KAF5482802.1 hypothetical protein CGCS363_v015156 [Colletotrichum siamense]